MPERPTWHGSKQKLVLAFDLGMTYSGISYSILDPGQVPVVRSVTKFPSQEEIKGAPKIPTVLYYDQDGTVQASGAETQVEEIYAQALENNWVKVEWFKLHLRPKSGNDPSVARSLPPLPPNKTVVDVMADFLKYLLRCAKTFISEAHLYGDRLWDSVEDNIEYVLTHPNGWEGYEQSQIRQAAVLAGLVPNMDVGECRISLLTEGEASLHFAVQHGLSMDTLQPDDGVIVVDAGGGTIDISTYGKVFDGADTLFEEIHPAQCYLFGSVFVSIHARLFLENYLADSPFLQDLDHIQQCFDKTTKLRFRDSEQPQMIRFGTPRDNDASHNIRFGQLKLQGSDVASFFEPSICSIVKALLKIKKASRRKISHVVLVGGFAASDWLYQQVCKRLANDTVNVVRPNIGGYLNKAVTDGAMSFYLDHLVKARMTRVAYGLGVTTIYNPADPEHVRRRNSMVLDKKGVWRLHGSFGMITPKGTQISEGTESRISVSLIVDTEEDLKAYEGAQIICYRGEKPKPEWLDVEQDSYTKLCAIWVDLSGSPREVSVGPGGVTVYTVPFDVVLSFGLTEIKAQVAWKEGYVEKRGPAKVIYYGLDGKHRVRQ